MADLAALDSKGKTDSRASLLGKLLPGGVPLFHQLDELFRSNDNRLIDSLRTRKHADDLSHLRSDNPEEGIAAGFVATSFSGQHQIEIRQHGFEEIRHFVIQECGEHFERRLEREIDAFLHAVVFAVFDAVFHRIQNMRQKAPAKPSWNRASPAAKGVQGKRSFSLNTFNL